MAGDGNKSEHLLKVVGVDDLNLFLFYFLAEPKMAKLTVVLTFLEDIASNFFAN